MSAHSTASHNSQPHSSAKFPHARPRATAIKLAAELARELGMVATWPNIQTIRLAIESEAVYSEVSVGIAAAAILYGAKEFSMPPRDRPRNPLDDSRVLRLNRIDRFWFEDSRWRDKDAYHQILSRLLQQREAMGAE